MNIRLLLFFFFVLESTQQIRFISAPLFGLRTLLATRHSLSSDSSASGGPTGLDCAGEVFLLL